jgi:putative ABC transport system permease protein
MSYVPLTPRDLVLAAALILVNAGLSFAFRLGLERSLFIAAARMVVQLGLIGFVLKFIFAQTSPAWTLLLALVMVGFAGAEVLGRQQRRPAGPAAYALGTGTLLFVGLFATVFAVAGVIGPEPWYAPRYVLPILGMVLGSTLTSVSLALQTLTEGAERERAAIEARLALGATRLEAFSDLLRRAMRTAVTPLVNQMSVAGIVTLPGMMTGQILAGADPAEAARYQIMIILVLTGASGLGALAAVYGGVLLLTDARHRLRLDRLAPARAAG